MRLGRFDLHLVGDGGFRLDGGAMFGVVPRVLWERVKPPDERNRIAMASNCLLVRSPEGTLLIDSGLGDKHDERFRDLFGLEDGARRLPRALAEVGCAPESIDHVLLTHLHFDHCGWNTCEKGGRLVPTFPGARYWVEESELRHAAEPNERDRASYDARNWEPLLGAGVLESFSNEAEPLPGVRAVRAPGHNEGMCIVLLDGGDGQRAAFLADLVPTAAHLPYPWIMGFDLYPMKTLESKKRWLPSLAAEDRICFFEHDPEIPAARLIEERPGRFAAEPLEVA